MHKSTLYSAIALALLLSACKNNNDSFDYKAGSGNETPREHTAHYNDAGNQAHPDKADHTPATVMNEADSLNPADRATLVKMIESNRKEIAFSELGSRRLNNADLKRLAAMLVEHHQQILTNLNRLAESKMVALPATTAAPTLNAATGDAFDQQWLRMQIDMHNQSIAANRSAAGTVQSPAFQTLIKSAIPTIESHLRELQQKAPE